MIDNFRDLLNAGFGVKTLDIKEINDLYNTICNEEPIEEMIRNHCAYYLKKPDFVDIQTITKGNSYQVDKTDFVKQILKAENPFDIINQMPCTLKLAGLQVTSPAIKSFLRAVYKKFKISIFSNMYISPPGDTQGYTYHVDPHKVFMIHLRGVKRWFYPIDRQGDYHYFPEIFDSSKNQSFENVQEVDYKPGDIKYTSKGIVHKAINLGTEPVVHCTFPLNQTDNFYLFKEYMSQISDFSVTELNNVQLCKNEDEVKKILKKRFDTFKIKKIVSGHKLKAEMKNLFILKNGRPYSPSAIVNYQKLFLKL